MSVLTRIASAAAAIAVKLASLTALTQGWSEKPEFGANATKLDRRTSTTEQKGGYDGT